MKGMTIVFAAFILAGLTSCAQSKNGIKKAHGFYAEHIPGNIMADNEVRPAQSHNDTVYLVYIETSNASIKWLKAWSGTQSFSIQATDLTDNHQVEVGVNKSTEKKIELKPSPGNRLWLLQLTNDDVLSKAPQKVTHGELIIQGRLGKKVFTQKISPLIEIESIPSV